MDPRDVGEPRTGSPWWYEYPDDPIRSDFRNLVFLVWEHLGLPEPTPAQYDIATFVQHGWAAYGVYLDSEGNEIPGVGFEWYGDEPVEPSRENVKRMALPSPQGREDVLEAFRGIGKSYITSTYVLWRLLRDPYNEKCLIVSASGSKSKEFVSMTKTLLQTMDLFEHLRPREDQRDTAYAFDVNGASISQSPSLKAAGITGQITGSRATLIVADDIEVTDNSRTEEARLRILHKTNEFSAIKVTGGADVICLGTPQSEESIYNKLIKEQGYLGWIMPARYPHGDKRASYKQQMANGKSWDCLAPRARKVDADPRVAWLPTDPERFNEAELSNRETKGRAYFALQFMLDTSLSDAERYPLKLRDLIVMAINPFKAPAIVQWGHDSNGKNRRHDLENYGFSGDHWLGPLFVDHEWATFEQSVLAVDPSGRGKDETAWAVVKVLHGMLFVVESGGFAGDMGEGMMHIALAAKAHNVNEIIVEPNYAGAVWIAAFQPVLASVWPPKKPGDTAGCSVIESVWSKGQKEVRIADTLEPVMNLHRMVVDERVAQDEVLMYQLTHLTRERGCLQHDDRVDALALAVSHLQNSLMISVDDAAKAMKDAEEDEVIAAWLRQHEHASSGSQRVYGTGWHEMDDGEDYEVYSAHVQ